MPRLRLPKLSFFGVTKTDGGEEYTSSDYAYVPDPSKPNTWKIRLKEYVGGKKVETSAQVGRAAAALGKGFRGNKAQIPSGDLSAVVARVRAAWKRQNPGKDAKEMPEGIKMSADFAVTDPIAGIVRRWTKLFTTGDYPDKEFSLTPEEMAKAVDVFAPVPIDLQHTNTVLDGKLGLLESVEPSDDGTELFGMVAIPTWLDGLIDGSQRAVSTTWDKTTKTLKGLAIVTEARVDDAVMMAAFEKASKLPKLPDPPVTFKDIETAVEKQDMPTILSALLARIDDEVALAGVVSFASRHDTREGQSTLQNLHDTSARYGAVCADPNVKMASAHESQALQAIHDMTTEHGATCSDMSKSTPGWYFSSATVATQQAATPPEETDGMKTLEEVLREFFGGSKDTPGAPGSEPPPANVATPAVSSPATPAVAETTTHPAADPEKVLLQEEVNRLRAEGIQIRATTFADRVIREGRALPVERDALIVSFTQAAVDDMRLPGTVKFADGKDASRVQILEAQIGARKPNMLDSERLPSELVGLINMSKTTPASETGSTSKETIDGMIATTAAGQQHIARRNGNQN